MPARSSRFALRRDLRNVSLTKFRLIGGRLFLGSLAFGACCTCGASPTASARLAARPVATTSGSAPAASRTAPTDQPPQPPITVVASPDPAGPTRNGVTWLPSGTVVPADSLIAHVTISAATEMGLTGGEHTSPAPNSYPTLSRDYGRTWRIAGPLLYYPGGHGGESVDSLVVFAGGGLMIWGQGSNFVHVTTDLGTHWHTAAFLAGDGLTSAASKGAQLTVTVRLDSQDGTRHTDYVYVSTDNGLTWRR